MPHPAKTRGICAVVCLGRCGNGSQDAGPDDGTPDAVRRMVVRRALMSRSSQQRRGRSSPHCAGNAGIWPSGTACPFARPRGRRAAEIGRPAGSDGWKAPLQAGAQAGGGGDHGGGSRVDGLNDSSAGSTSPCREPGHERSSVGALYSARMTCWPTRPERPSTPLPQPPSRRGESNSPETHRGELARSWPSRPRRHP
jgi:hypothetical protein